MAYGILVTNNAGETVINDTDPLMVSKRSGSLSAYTTLGGNSQFFEPVASPMIPVDNEMVVIEVPVASWIMHGEGYVDGSSVLGNYSSNMDPINYTVVGSRADSAAPAQAYGMAVYDSLGACVWDDASSVAKLIGGGMIPAAATDNINYSLVVPTTANAIFLQGGTIITDSVGGDKAGIRATRDSTSQWTFSMEPFGPAISSNLVSNQRDLFYMFAEIV